MNFLDPELAGEHQRQLLAQAAAWREASQARQHRGVTRQVERAERRAAAQRQQARRLRLRLRELES